MHAIWYHLDSTFMLLHITNTSRNAKESPSGKYMIMAATVFIILWWLKIKIHFVFIFTLFSHGQIS